MKHLAYILPPLIMEVENRCVSNISFLSFRVISTSMIMGERVNTLYFKMSQFFPMIQRAPPNPSPVRHPRIQHSAIQLSKIYHTFVYHNYGCLFPWFLKNSKLVALVFSCHFGFVHHHHRHPSRTFCPSRVKRRWSSLICCVSRRRSACKRRSSSAWLWPQRSAL